MAVNHDGAMMVDRRFRRFFRSIVAAPECLLCAGAITSEHLICRGCQADLPRNEPACLCCAQSLSVAPSRICADCIEKPPPFDRAFAPFRYRGAVAQAVQSLKYNANFLTADWLGEAMIERIRLRAEPLPQIVIPVPLHRARLRERGFNQAQEIAKVVARGLQLPLEPNWARRTRSTIDQIGLNAVQRRRNLKGAFAIDGRVAGLHVALVDDVMTTGSTLTELARACRKAGAESIELWIAARA
jgi:ComF family protein